MQSCVSCWGAKAIPHHFSVCTEVIRLKMFDISYAIDIRWIHIGLINALQSNSIDNDSISTEAATNQDSPLVMHLYTSISKPI